MARHLNVKGLLKLPDFTGRDGEFVAIYETSMNILAAMDSDEITEHIDHMPEPPSFAVMNPWQMQQPKLLHVLPRHVTQNAGWATALVRRVKDRNSFWAWNSLCQEIRKASADRLTGMHDCLPHPE